MKPTPLLLVGALLLVQCKSEPKSEKPSTAAPVTSVTQAAPPSVAAPTASASASTVVKVEKRSGPRWLRKLPVDSVSASTELAKGGFYPGKRAFDGSRATTWIALLYR